MKKAASLLAILVVSACTNVGPGGFMRDLPEGLEELAAPNQNLDAVKLMDDGCYWYQHNGPVETTMLPLRSKRGNPLCAAPAESA
ncbi:MAG: hypothetical protein AAFR73_04400 [Pseudomonadota bacterium]